MNRTSDEITIKGSVQSFSIQTGATIGLEEPLTDFPVSFSGHLKNHELSFDSIDQTIDCGSPLQTTLSSLQRDLFIIPLQAGIGTTWQDSVTSTVCSGSLPVKLTDLRYYKIIAEIEQNGIPAFSIDRKQKTLFSGEGSQDQHRIAIKGETVGTGLIYANRSDGFLLHLSAESRTTLQIQTSGRIQNFLQISKEILNRN